MRDDDLAPIVIMASNRGDSPIHDTDYRSPPGLPLDFLDRVVIISTHSAQRRNRADLSIRVQEEEIDVFPDALALLTKIGQEAGLRYASNLISTSQLVSAKRRAK